MFYNKNLIFLHLQKTAGTHITALFLNYLEGQTGAKHGRPEVDVADKIKIASIRDPWSFYVSLWAYGASGRGGLRQRLVTKLHFRYKYTLWQQRDYRFPYVFARECADEILRPTHQIRKIYEGEGSDSFKSWLKFILNSDSKYSLGENYAASSVSEIAGLYTFRYMNLFSRDLHWLYSKKLTSFSKLKSLWPSENSIDHFIRVENLAEDFIDVMNKCGQMLSDEQIEEIRGKEATNRSTHKKISYYYDNESYQLVNDRERLIIDNHGYKEIGRKLLDDING